nr:helix-turn-helix domain-containing protein [uncultured Ruminococcus sp.]
MKENDYRFGNFVCQLREENGMTQAELAEQLNVTPAAVSKWENGESKPRTEKLFELAKLLGVTAEELINGEKKPQQPIMQPTIPYRPNALPSNDTRFRRVGAFFLDALICEFAGILTIPISFALSSDRASLSYNLFLSANFVAMILMVFRDLIINGRSLGKRITRITVANAVDGSRPKWYKLILRNLPFFIYFIDFFVLIINGRSLGDMLTDTFTPPYIKYKGIDGQPVTSNHVLAQGFTTPPKKKRKVFIIVICVLIGFVLLFTTVFTLGFHHAKQSPAYPLAIEYATVSDRLSQYDLTESDFTLHSYHSVRQNGTPYEIFGFWVKGQDIYVTVTTQNGETKVFFANNSSEPPS